MYRLRGSNWGSQASSLANEALATFLSLTAAESSRSGFRVLDIGCGAGRDSIFFAKNGFEVIAVDISEVGLQNLRFEAEIQGVGDKITTICGNIQNIDLPGEFDIIFSNYCFHFFKPKDRYAIIKKIQRHTKAGGINYILALSDLNEEIVGSIHDYSYLSFSELRRNYQHWNVIEDYEGHSSAKQGPDKIYNHMISLIGAQNQPRVRTLYRPAVNNLFFGSLFGLLSFLLCTLGYNPSSDHLLAKIWPAAIFQPFASACLGGFGVIMGVLSSSAVVVSFSSVYQSLAFLPANLIQALIPA
jgi:SAM-dependent methyltransferase